MANTTDFHRACYKLVSQIPAGRVTTYKAIADKIGAKSYRVVGKILKENPTPVKVPCHRVVKSDGTIGGYLGKLEANISKKIALLKSEGVEVDEGIVLDFEQKLHKFK